MALPYPFHVIEAHWRQRWDEAELGRVDFESVDPDRIFYNLVEFPYPFRLPRVCTSVTCSATAE